MIDDSIRPELGVIGGLGPLASADFYFKLTRMTPALRDEDHLPAVILSIPQLPDRTEAILSGSDVLDAPLDAAISTLNALGVKYIAMPCNTVHHWYDRLAALSKAEIIHIGDAVIADVRRHLSGGKVAILATRGTLASGLYQDRLVAAGFAPAVDVTADFQPDVDAAIHLVKAGAIEDAAAATERAIRAAAEAGADAAILGCTELSVVAQSLKPTDLAIIDSNAALARVCLERCGY